MTPYQRIMKAAKKGKGVRLSRLEVAHMANDTTINELAENDDADDVSENQPPKEQQ